MKILTTIIMAVSITGCAFTQLKKDYKEKRGYSDADMTLIMDQAGAYQKILNRGALSSNAFNSTPALEADARVRNVFCSCVKKLGDKCQKKPDGLSPDDKLLWIKGNAAEMAPMINAAAWESDVHYDPAEYL